VTSRSQTTTTRYGTRPNRPVGGTARERRRSRGSACGLRDDPRRRDRRRRRAPCRWCTRPRRPPGRVRHWPWPRSGSDRSRRRPRLLRVDRRVLIELQFVILVRFVDATFSSTTALCEKSRFTTNPRHVFIVLPGSGIRTEVQSGRAAVDRALRGRFASDLILRRGTAQWRTAWRSPRAVHHRHGARRRRRSATRIVSKTARTARFVASRVVPPTGRLGPGSGDRVVCMFDFLTSLNAIVYHFTRHTFESHTSHGSFWDNSCSTSYSGGR